MKIFWPIKINEISPSDYKRITFYTMFLMLLTVSMFDLLTTNGIALNNLLYENMHDTFMDFYNPISWGNENFAYLNPWRCYPPLANFIYSLFYKITPNQICLIGSNAIKQSNQGIFIFYIYNVILISTLSIAIFTIKRGCLFEKLFFMLFLLFSPSYLYTYERGNIILFVNILLLYFYLCQQSNNRIANEIALLLLAIASAIKIYPFIFIFIYLRSKQFVYAFRCLFYTVMLFILPSVYLGNIDILFQFIDSLALYTNIAAGGFSVYQVSLTNFIFWINEHIAITNILYVNKIMSTIMLLGGIWAFFYHKIEWKRITILSCLMIIIPAFSAYYAIILMTLSIILFLDNNTFYYLDCLYFVLFFMLMTPLLVKNVIFNANLAVIIMLSVLIFDSFVCYILRSLKDQS